VILRGKVYVSDELNVKLTEENKRFYAKFTKQEIKVIELVKANKTNAQIADDLFKTGVSSREELRML